jgi:glycosyltransferase involved in cell wall biosynthesis
MRPRLGVLTYRPIQYHTPLYQRLAKRGNVELDVLFLSDGAYRPMMDSGFGTIVAWDIDMLSGYSYQFLTTAESSMSRAERITALARWLPSHDAVVIHGYADPWMLLAMTICRMRRIPYLLRGASQPQTQATGMRRHLRHAVARAAVSASACGLPVGQLSEEFFHRYGARRVIVAPNSVDDERFARPPQVGRSELLTRWGLDDTRPVVIFSGKLIPRKRPLDLIAAVERLPQLITTLIVGDGSMAEQVRASLKPGDGVVTGFINQSELPAYYHAADILVLPSEVEVWGLVVNEAMAAGVFPVVSASVGAAPDLVRGVGEIYPCGNVESLTQALCRALARIKDPETRSRMRHHAARYSIDRTAAGYEEAAIAVTRAR